jgi:competence protein ComEA
MMFRTYRGRVAIIFLSLICTLFPIAAQATSASGNGSDKAARSSRLIDINRATASELKTLPGIRDAYAAAIVKNRPYKNKAQLLSKQVIPEAAYGKIKSKIIARQ